jgi:hypothetical protein
VSRAQSRRTGKLGVRLALFTGIAAGGGSAVVALLMQPVGTREWLFGMLASLVVGAVVGVIAWSQGSGIGSRLTDLGLAVAKLGRGASEVRVRVTGNDEVTAVGRALQYLSTDLQAMFSEMDQGRGQSATMDPQVRELRDKTLDEPMAAAEGFEVDGAIGAGSRGGGDYFGAISGVVYVVSAEGGSALSVVAARLARDEIVRALEAGASARKALAHTNRVMHKKLPGGVCAKASLLELAPSEVKLYQAGFRAPLWICQAGEVLEISAEGLALGLDEGPVFEKGLRSQRIPVQPGVRLVQTNESGVRSQDLLDLVRDHSPKHTAPFLHLAIGTLENDAGPEGLREDVLLVTVKRVG